MSPLEWILVLAGFFALFKWLSGKLMDKFPALKRRALGYPVLGLLLIALWFLLALLLAALDVRLR